MPLIASFCSSLNLAFRQLYLPNVFIFRMVNCGGSFTGILPLFSFGLHTCLVASPESFGDYLKEKVSLFMLKISCNYKVIHSFTIIISFY